MKKLILTCILYGSLHADQIKIVQETKTTTTVVIDFDKSLYKWSKPLSETFHLINKRYVKSVDPEQPIKDAISTMIKKLDPHSYFLDQQSYNEVTQTLKGELSGGIGIIVDNTKEPDDEFLRIIDTIPGGPSDSAGMKAEDKIIAIDGQPVKGMTLDEAIAKLKGKRNTTVMVKVQRSDTIRHLDFTLKRDIVKGPNSLCYAFKGHDIYYICFTLFTTNSVQQIEQLLEKIKKLSSQQLPKALIIDLRNNTGGLLDVALDIAGRFVGKNKTVVVTKGRDDKEIERFVTTKEQLHDPRIPVFILVNNFTASAAEILAGCMQIHSDLANSATDKQPFVFIVGTKTFGKGTVQEVIPLSLDCAIALTTAVYYLPNNIAIQGIGIQPDFQIEQKIPPSQETIWFNNTFGRESSYKNAITLDRQAANPMHKEEKSTDKKDSEKSWHEKKQDTISSDYLILSTVRLAEIFDLAKKVHGDTIKTRNDALTLLKKVYTPQDKAEIEEIKID